MGSAQQRAPCKSCVQWMHHRAIIILYLVGDIYYVWIFYFTKRDWWGKTTFSILQCHLANNRGSNILMFHCKHTGAQVEGKYSLTWSFSVILPKRCLSIILSCCEEKNGSLTLTLFVFSHFTSATFVFLILPQEIPQQMNGSDCGMFTCKYAEYITKEKPIKFTQVIQPHHFITFVLCNCGEKLTLFFTESFLLRDTCRISEEGWFGSWWTVGCCDAGRIGSSAGGPT